MAPTATSVAECSKADTGVGPAMARCNQCGKNRCQGHGNQTQRHFRQARQNFLRGGTTQGHRQQSQSRHKADADTNQCDCLGHPAQWQNQNGGQKWSQQDN